MTKRRSVMLGLGALATGSGAVFASGAFGSDFASPDADLRVIADAQLRVRSVRDSAGNPAVAAQNDPTGFSGRGGDLGASDFYVADDGTSPDFDTFFNDNVEGLIGSPGAPRVAALEINEQINSELAMRTVFSNGITGAFDPLIEITNNDDTAYNIAINYAQNDGDSDIIDGENGYGSDVNTTAGEFTDSAAGQLSRQAVQDIYQFHLTEADVDDRNDYSGSERILSPEPSNTGVTDPADEHTEDPYNLSSGETVFLNLKINTDSGESGNLIPQINTAAAGGDDVFGGNANLDLLNQIYITATE